jgi:hypothetical protein
VREITQDPHPGSARTQSMKTAWPRASVGGWLRAIVAREGGGIVAQEGLWRVLIRAMTWQRERGAAGERLSKRRSGELPSVQEHAEGGLPGGTVDGTVNGPMQEGLTKKIRWQASEIRAAVRPLPHAQFTVLSTVPTAGFGQRAACWHGGKRTFKFSQQAGFRALSPVLGSLKHSAGSPGTVSTQHKLHSRHSEALRANDALQRAR